MKMALALAAWLACSSGASAQVAKISLNIPRIGAPVVPAPSLTAPVHWKPSAIPDLRYAELLDAGAAQLFSAEAAAAAQPAVLKEMLQKDPRTHSHLMRVGLLASLISLGMGHPLETALRIGWGARLHDAGKLDGSILELVNKPRELTPEERRIVEKHPELGVDILMRQADLPVELQWAAMRTSLSHHEKWDGSGYPMRLSGNMIPLEARITTVADYFDSLLENRPYRAALTLEQALQVMDKVKDGFDPAAYQALLRLLK